MATSSQGSLLGAVLYCWMPHSETPLQPGPKFRPVLVIDHDTATNKVRVAPGTTQRLASLYRGEILIESVLGGAGLHQPTKFKVKQASWLPLTPAFFKGHGNEHRFGGVIPLHRVRELHEIVREALPELRHSSPCLREAVAVG
nr:hypothetical protein [uncultured Halomonas sp.]